LVFNPLISQQIDLQFGSVSAKLEKKMDEKKYNVNNTSTISCEWVIRASSTLKYPLLLNFYTREREGK
jgi:hypothetical protein